MNHSKNGFATPILFLIYNRPEITKTTFAQIRRIKPEKLFIAADGPKENKKSDNLNCLAARNIIRQIDWKCGLKTLFRETNLGCRLAVGSAIDWFFNNVDEGIIIEDDCLPDISFFDFCENLLKLYKNNERIMMISGVNFQDGKIRGDGSYYFSKYCHIWGWATWKRAWTHYDVNMESFPLFLAEKKIKTIFAGKEMRDYWLDIFSAAYENKINTRDYQWVYAVLNNGGLNIIPNCNLVTNIGFGKKATFTTNASDIFANVKINKMGEIIHPHLIGQNTQADEYTFYKNHKKQDKLSRSEERRVGKECRSRWSPYH